jgi:hypothetical protein
LPLQSPAHLCTLPWIISISTDLDRLILGTPGFHAVANSRVWQRHDDERAPVQYFLPGSTLHLGTYLSTEGNMPPHALFNGCAQAPARATHQSQSNLGPHSAHVPDSSGVQDFDPYNYTGARWLRNDNQQRQLRYINFDFTALSEKVLALSGAKSVTNCEKIEGGSHRIFLFTCDNGNRIVARLPCKPAGPPSLTTASEVATTRYRQPTL